VVESVTPANLLPGNNPKAQLVLGADGAFYGTTQFGGSSNVGAVFKVTTAGVMTTLVNFYGANGAQPWSGLLRASDGNFYGTTSAGGASNLGTIFRMTPSGTLDDIGASDRHDWDHPESSADPGNRWQPLRHDFDRRQQQQRHGL